MRGMVFALLSGVTLTQCASSLIGQSADGAVATTDVATDSVTVDDAGVFTHVDVLSPTVMPMCGVAPTPCNEAGRLCRNACGAEGLCVEWRAVRFDGGIAALPPSCAVARRQRCMQVSSFSFSACEAGYVCPDNVSPIAETCIRASDCLAFQQAHRARFTESSLRRPACLYGDNTVVRTGALAPAHCREGRTPTCGLGCPSCPAGSTCLFASERSPTGVCAVYESNYPARACSRLDRSNTCGPGDACLLPLRDDADNVRDDLRPGVCIPRADCQAIAREVPASYFCMTFGA